MTKAKSKTEKKGSYQPEYTEEEKNEIWEKVCYEIANGSNLDRLGKDKKFPGKQTLYNWRRDCEAKQDAYTRARENRADARADRIDNICKKVEDGKLDPNAARVIIDAEKWQAGKENNTRYGDKLELNGKLETKLSDEQLESQLTKLLGKVAASETPTGEGEASETEAD